MNRKKLEPNNHINPEILFDQLLQISADGMRLTDKKGRILQVNDAYCRMIDMKRSDLEGENFINVYLARDRRKILKTYENHILHKDLPAHNEGRFRLWNGRMLWFEFSNSLLEIPGSGYFVLSIIKDITPRKKAQMKLAYSENRFRLLFNHAYDAVFVIQLSEDNKLDCFIEVNRIACERYLYSQEEFRALNPYALIPEKYYETINSRLHELAKKKHALFRIENLRKDKRRIPVEISAIYFEFKKRPTVLFIARDITKRKKVELRLKNTGAQLRSLAGRLQAIREEERALIAREIHDELGQTMTVLKIQLSLLIRKIYPHDETKREPFRPILQLIDQAVDSVQQISAKLRPGILDELGLTAAIEWQTKDFQKRTGISCRCSLLKDDLRLQEEKTTAIFRIFQEALTNVARHAQAQRVSVFLRKENGELILEVTDNGRGITKEQINASRSLGILGMQERAMVFGGQVTINGVPGEGTSLKVEMPLDEQEG